MINQCPHQQHEFKQHDDMKPTRNLTRFLVMAAAVLYTGVASAHTFQSAGLVSRPVSLPSGAFGPVFSMESGILAAWQARDSGRVVIYDLSGTPTHRSTINTPDSVFDNPAFGGRVSFSGAGNIFIASPFTWLTAPHDGRVYSYDITNPASPALSYKFAQNAHSAGYFGADLCVEGDVLVAAQGANGGSPQTRAGVYFYRINTDKTVTLIGQQLRTSDFMNPVGCAISGDVCVAAFQVLSDTPAAGECWMFRINRTAGVPTSVSTAVSLPIASSTSNPARAQPSGGASFFRIAFKNSLLAVANFGADTVAADNEVAIYRVETPGSTVSATLSATIPAPGTASSRFGRRLLFAWNRLLVSDPETVRPGTTAKGKVHVYAVDSAGSVTNEGEIASQTNGPTEAFGEFLAFDPTLGAGGVLGVGCRQDVSNLAADHDIQLFSALPEITVEEQGGPALTDGVGTKDLGVLPVGGQSTPVTYIIRNTGLGNLANLALAKAGTHVADFSLGVLPSNSLASGEQTTFSVTFSPVAGATGQRTATVQIANNDSDENPFDLGVIGQAYSTTLDADGDGMNDWGEYNLSSMGFDWQVNNAALVTTLMSKANTAGLFTASQVQDINVGSPLIQRNPSSGEFTLTFGVEKSTNLSSFVPFPMTAPQTLINGQGKLEFRFTVPDNAAFFRLKAQ